MLGQLGRLHLGGDAAGTSASSSNLNVTRASFAVGQKALVSAGQRGGAATLPGRPQARLALQTASPDVDARNLHSAGRRQQAAPEVQVGGGWSVGQAGVRCALPGSRPPRHPGEACARAWGGLQGGEAAVVGVWAWARARAMLRSSLPL